MELSTTIYTLTNAFLLFYSYLFIILFTSFLLFLIGFGILIFLLLAAINLPIILSIYFSFYHGKNWLENISGKKSILNSTPKN